MVKDPFVREKFTGNLNHARKLAAEYFERFPKERYHTEVESWRDSPGQARRTRQGRASSGGRCRTKRQKALADQAAAARAQGTR
jgi:hypothetical protein